MSPSSGEAIASTTSTSTTVQDDVAVVTYRGEILRQREFDDLITSADGLTAEDVVGVWLLSRTAAVMLDELEIDAAEFVDSGAFEAANHAEWGSSFHSLLSSLTAQPLAVERAARSAYDIGEVPLPDMACFSFLTVATLEEADAVVAEARAGADFAALARERSLDDTFRRLGGDARCQPFGLRFLDGWDEVAAATGVGVSDPFPTRGHFGVLSIRSIGSPTIETHPELTEEALQSARILLVDQWVTDEVDAFVRLVIGRLLADADEVTTAAELDGWADSVISVTLWWP
ncbi:MAG: hypothetical protein AAGC53_01600 [Actinomycetota bacterium]